VIDQHFLRSIRPVAVAAMLSLSAALAQSSLDEVHIQPRVHPSQLDYLNSLAKNATGIIRKNVELVLVPVTVTDGYNRIVVGLSQENFKLYENKQALQIKHFWSEDAPISVGIVLDLSGSMKRKIERARDAVMSLLKDSNPQDEFFLTTFADKPVLLHDFTSNVEEIEDQLLTMTPKGQTCLLDAIVLAVNTMRTARYQRRALVIISDGGDNRSRYTETEVKSMIKEQDVLVYSIGVFDSELQTLEERLGPELLEDISSVTGASSYTLDDPRDLPAAAERIAYELRNQYVLGYAPDGSRRDGKWRKIKVKLALPKGMAHLSVQTRTGYYGPQ
jgi:Ca-activated chloride channel family protein